MKFIIKKSMNGQFYFVLKARNGEVLCTSELYTTERMCRKGISAVKKSLFAQILVMA
jgi:uncharacterized protein YegP (UPF0339 family)